MPQKNTRGPTLIHAGNGRVGSLDFHTCQATRRLSSPYLLFPLLPAPHPISGDHMGGLIPPFPPHSEHVRALRGESGFHYHLVSVKELCQFWHRTTLTDVLISRRWYY